MPAATAGLIILIAWRATSITSQVDASQDRRAIVYATAVLATAPQNAIIVSDSDQDTFPIWYYHYVLGERPDLVVLVEPLLDFDWYRHNLRAIHPDLQIPNTTNASWLDAITLANRQRRIRCHTQLVGLSMLACEQIIQ